MVAPELDPHRSFALSLGCGRLSGHGSRFLSRIGRALGSVSAAASAQVLGTIVPDPLTCRLALGSPRYVIVPLPLTRALRVSVTWMSAVPLPEMETSAVVVRS